MDRAQGAKKEVDEKFAESFMAELEKHSFSMYGIFKESVSYNERIGSARKFAPNPGTNPIKEVQLLVHNPSSRILALLKPYGACTNRKIDYSEATVSLCKFDSSLTKQIECLHSKKLVDRPLRKPSEKQQEEKKFVSTNINEVQLCHPHNDNALESKLFTK